MESSIDPKDKSTETTAPEKKSNSKFLFVFIALVIIGGGYGFIKYLHSKKHIETDDAQIGALMSPMIPHVSGYIAKVFVADNQEVKKGDTLVLLDDRDFKVRLAAAMADQQAAISNLTIAKAGLQVNKADVSSSEAKINTIDAQIEAAYVTLWRANTDFTRYANSLKDGGVTQQQYDAALATKKSAERQLDILNSQKKGASKAVVAISSQKPINAGQISAAEALLAKSAAEVEAAKLSLSYTALVAEADGQVSKVNLQPGQYVQEGQALFSLVSKDAKWVVANFKETQLKKMKVGQKVLVTVDAYPDSKLEAMVSSLSPATGAAESILPPDNASGNFVKVVQRLPVKIEFIHPDDDRVKKLSVGLNVLVDVLIDSLIIK